MHTKGEGCAAAAAAGGHEAPHLVEDDVGVGDEHVAPAQDRRRVLAHAAGAQPAEDVVPQVVLARHLHHLPGPRLLRKRLCLEHHVRTRSGRVFFFI
jgi:hypothetical protein